MGQCPETTPALKLHHVRDSTETTPKKSARAALIKIGDKTSNVRAVALTPPDWPQDRKAAYVAWARSVVAALPEDVPASARAEFAAACALHSQAGTEAPDAKRYEVFVDDNFHFMDESERVAAGSFATIEEAVEKCREIVLNDLRHLLEWKPDLTAKELAGEWSAWGEDPWIRGGAFSAREFVEAMSPSLVAERVRRETEASDGPVDGSMAE